MMFNVSRKTPMGFTIIELLLVLGIMTIITATGTLALFSFRAKQNLNLSAQEIVTVLRSAQNNSISQELLSSGEKWGVHFENDYYALFKGTSFNVSNIVSKSTLKSGVIFSGFSNSAGPQGSIDVIFAATSGFSDDSYIVTLSLTGGSSGEQKSIIINKNGLISF